MNLLDEEPTPSKRVHRTSYPMLEATRVSPQSDSEDELVLRPSAQHPRVPARPEKATSTTENSQQDESLFFSAEESLDGRSDGSDKHQRTDRSLDDGQPPPRRPTLFRGGKILRESTERSSVDPIDLLDRFQASKTRRLRLPSTSSASSDKPRSKLIDQYFQPKRSEKRSIVSTKRRQPPASSSNIPNSLPNLHNHKESAKSTSALSSKRAAPPSAPISSKRQQPSATPTNQAQPAPSSKHPATASSSHQRISNVFPTVRSEQSQPQHSAPKATPDRGSTSNPIKKPDATTPKPARNSRKSMTPHFPPSTKKKQKEAKTASPTLRGGSSDSPAALNGTLDMASHRHRRAPSPSLVTDREQIRSLLDSRPAGPFVVDNNDHSIELGSPITASERDTTDELGNPSPPVSRRAMPGIIMLGSPVTPSSSSSSSSSEERRSGPRDAGELRSPCTPSSRGASRKKRRRSVSSSGSGSGSGSAAGGGGRSGYGIPRR